MWLRCECQLHDNHRTKGTNVFSRLIALYYKRQWVIKQGMNKTACIHHEFIARRDSRCLFSHIHKKHSEYECLAEKGTNAIEEFFQSSSSPWWWGRNMQRLYALLPFVSVVVTIFMCSFFPVTAFSPWKDPGKSMQRPWSLPSLEASSFRSTRFSWSPLPVAWRDNFSETFFCKSVGNYNRYHMKGKRASMFHSTCIFENVRKAWTPQEDGCKERINFNSLLSCHCLFSFLKKKTSQSERETFICTKKIDPIALRK